MVSFLTPPTPVVLFRVRELRTFPYFFTDGTNSKYFHLLIIALCYNKVKRDNIMNFEKMKNLEGGGLILSAQNPAYKTFPKLDHNMARSLHMQEACQCAR